MQQTPQSPEQQRAPVQIEPAERRYAEELAFLAAHDTGPRPPGWRLTPRAVVTFVVGSDGARLRLAAPVEGLPTALEITPKFVGDRGLVERSVVTLAGERGLLLVGEPGTAKSMLSELLAAAVSGSGALTVQGTAGTTEEHLRYGWNYALLLAKGPTPEALAPSPVLTALRTGRLARVEEITRCLPEVQDALVSILSDRRMAVPELAGQAGADGAATDDAGHILAAPGFNVIATANLRDRGVSEMSAALKRRFNFEVVPPIGDLDAEIALVRRQAGAALRRHGAETAVDDAVLEALITAFRDLRSGQTAEGWAVERPSTVMSTAEAVGVTTSLGLQTAYLGVSDPLSLVPGYLLGTVRKDEPADQAKLLAYWDGTVRHRAENGARLWRRLYELRHVLGDG
ncbi:ATP-binding protein [Marinitenerispora sediminis]|uniref:AAA family ATPase n=1 Tax=Marinitenerispora sediminis TaxID=1931232 RepID=A0A368T6M3_9ACTN|nr:AAA family ATPase [Marinitenerispora sediminis]RCV48343.1 AAA family ATPase [Marinitenerispora sediminis]RCV51523.1 AAA family ATPase [Marinitenerispora sediminis]RCV59138.1 AAA family ATPase [Marinitenerispora sediminis]